MNKWAVSLAAAVALALPGVANAWTFAVSGSASCDSQTAEYVVTWTIDNSSEPEDLTIRASDRAAVPVGSTVPAKDSADFVERVTGTTAGHVWLKVSGNWKGDQGGKERSASVKLAGDCTPPPSVDQCPNIPGVQETVPPGMIKDAHGNCVTPPTPPVDQCPNIDGVQETVPPGMIKDAHGNCVTSPPPPMSDDCPNLPGIQGSVPEGMIKDSNGNCVSRPTTTTATTTTTAPPAALVQQGATASPPARPAAAPLAPQPAATPPVTSGVKAEVKTKGKQQAAKKVKKAKKAKAKVKAKVKSKRARGAILPITK
jgi:hypothetical protein